MQVSRYEKGQSLPSLDTAVRLAQVLKVSLDQLATGSDTVIAGQELEDLANRLPR